MEAKALTCNIVPGRLPRGRQRSLNLNKVRAAKWAMILHPKNGRQGRPKAAAATRWKERVKRYSNGA